MTRVHLFPSAGHALELVEAARSSGLLHTSAWVETLNAHAPEMSEAFDHVTPSGVRLRSLMPNETASPPVLLLAAPNDYARELDAFDAGARHLAEALQRPILLADPKGLNGLDFRTDVGPLLTATTPLGIVTEGSTTYLVQRWLKNSIARKRIKGVVCVHGNPLDLPALLPTYAVVPEADDGRAWSGLPSQPLALCRWIPEICTYLDPLRLWFDLHLH